MPLGWGDIAWDDIFSELAFLQATVLIMEVTRLAHPVFDEIVTGCNQACLSAIR